MLERRSYDVDHSRRRGILARRRWVAGWALVAVAVALAVVNLANEFRDAHFLPGAHTLLYLLLFVSLGGVGVSLLARQADGDTTRRSA